MKRIGIVLLVIVFSFTVTSCNKFDLADYKTLVSQCNDEINDEAVLLSNLGKYEYNYWDTLNNLGGKINYDTLVAGATEWLYKEADVSAETIEEKYKSICDNYKIIIGTDISGTEAEEISEKFSNLFDSFNSLYILVMTPSGDISDFYEDFSEHIDNIKNYSSVVSLLVT